MTLALPRSTRAGRSHDQGRVAAVTGRHSGTAKYTPQTRNARLTIEGVNGITLGAIEGAMEELFSLVREHCGGEVSWSLVGRDHPWAFVRHDRAASCQETTGASPRSRKPG